MANKYEQKRYKTQKGIETFHKVKYELLPNRKEFEAALEKLSSAEYYSFFAEKQRTVYGKKKISFNWDPETQLKKFVLLCNSFLSSIDINLTLDKVSSNPYQLINKNIYRFLYDKEAQTFKSVFIHKDVIYRDTFELYSKSNKCKIFVVKSLQSPFSLERTSLIANGIRIDFRSSWKKYIEEIEAGLRKW